MKSDQDCKTNQGDIINDVEVADEVLLNHHGQIDNTSTTSNSLERYCCSSIRSPVIYDSPQPISFYSNIEVIDEVVPNADIRNDKPHEDSSLTFSGHESLRKDNVSSSYCMGNNTKIVQEKSTYRDHGWFKNEYQNQDELRHLAFLQMPIEVPIWRVFPEFEALPNKNKILKSIEEAHELRLKTKDPTYASECIEEIDDETFLKRHVRHELDEKKRKRWDIQRLREQQEYERLKKAIEGRKGRKNKRNRETESKETNTQPSLEITHIIITDTTFLPRMDGDLASLSPPKSEKY